MKIFTSLLVAFCLTACATTPRPYDNMEYLVSTAITVDTARAIHQCAKPSIDYFGYVRDINSNALLLSEYLKNKPDSEKLVIVVQNEEMMINALLIRGNFSPMYCVEKLSNIQASSRILSRVLGESGNFDLCDGGIKSRYNMFTLSYSKNDITKSEYKELVGDIVLLESIDTSGCSVDNKRKMLDDLQFIESNLSTIIKL